MTHRRSALLGLLVVLAGSLVWAETEKGDKPAKDKAVKAEKAPKNHVAGRYGKLELTDDQRATIATIQQESEEKIKRIREEERERILVLLSPEQKEVLDKMEADEKAEKAARAKAYQEKKKHDHDDHKGHDHDHDKEKKEKAD